VATCGLWLFSPKKQKIKNAVKPITQRPTRKQLQNENTDAVWKELTYLQQENKTLKTDKYKHNLKCFCVHAWKHIINYKLYKPVGD